MGVSHDAQTLSLAIYSDHRKTCTILEWRNRRRDGGQYNLSRSEQRDGRPIGTKVNRLLQESCKQAPLTVALPVEVIEHIRAESLKGNRAEAIAKGLTVMLPDMPHEQLVSISRTIIGKASTVLERARSEDIDIHWYVWETCKDARVRKSHRKMHGVIVPWNSPPSPEGLIGEEEIEGKYHAGEALECRCLGLPLVSLSEVNWPHRVYHRGQIQRMTRVEFKRLSGMT